LRVNGVPKRRAGWAVRTRPGHSRGSPRHQSLGSQALPEPVRNRAVRPAAGSRRPAPQPPPRRRRCRRTPPEPRQGPPGVPAPTTIASGCPSSRYFPPSHRAGQAAASRSRSLRRSRHRPRSGRSGELVVGRQRQEPEHDLGGSARIRCRRSGGLNRRRSGRVGLQAGWVDKPTDAGQSVRAESRPNLSGDAPVVPGGGLLHVLDQVVPQMPTAGDLDRLRRPGRGSLGVAAGPVAAYHRHRRLGGEPAGDGGRLPIGQQVNRPATVEIDQDGAVAVAATHREVIHPH
jgi:hypothetical protein